MLRRFYGYAKDYRKYGFWSCICVALEVMVELVIPSVMADIIDVDVVNGDKEYILREGLEMCLLALIAPALGMMYVRLATLCGMGLDSELRKAEYQKIQSFSSASVDHFGTSSLVTRLTGDITVTRNAMTTGLRPVVRAPVMMVTALLLSFSISRELVLIFLVATLILVGCLYYIICHVRPLYSRMQMAIDMVNRIVQKNPATIRFVKAYVRGDYEMEKFERVSTELQTVSERALGTACLNMPAMQYVMYGIILPILWSGGNLMFIGGMQVDELTGFLSYVFQILNSLMMISNVFMMLTRSTASGHRILEVLGEETEIRDESTEQLEIKTGEIAFESVHFKYRKDAEEPVLPDVSFHILPGQTVGAIGGTGSAKTTLVQLIPRFYEATKGTVYVDGRLVLEYSLEHLRDAVAVVLQKNTLFSDTIEESLRWGKKGAISEEIKLVCEIVGADGFVERFPDGYQTVLEQDDVNLSGGQKQRLCIVRAILKSSKVLILDDSTSAADTATEAKIREGLAKNLKDATKVIIVQRITSVLHVDQIIIMDDGKVHAVRSHESLLASDSICQEIYYSQQEGMEL